MAFPTIKLVNDISLPVVAFGTGTAWYSRNPENFNRSLVDSVKKALSLGFRHIDGAEIYGTDREIAVAIEESNVPRDTLFVTTKVGPKSVKDPVRALDEALVRLRMEYVDLYLIHIPFGADLKQAWLEMEKTVTQGKARLIGVSNFRVQDLEEILSIASIKPVVNQIEYHPYLQQDEIVNFSHKHGILIESYTPLAPVTLAKGGPVDAVVEEIARKYNKTPGQILWKWNLQKGNVIISTSSKEERLKELLDLFSFQLEEDEVKKISEEGKKFHFRKYWTQYFVEGK